MPVSVLIVRIAPPSFETLRNQPDLFAQIADHEPKPMKQLGVTASHIAGFECAELTEAMLVAMGADCSMKFPSSDNYIVEPSFVLSPDAVQRAVDAFDDADAQKLMKSASKRGDYVIGTYAI